MFFNQQKPQRLYSQWQRNIDFEFM